MLSQDIFNVNLSLYFFGSYIIKIPVFKTCLSSKIILGLLKQKKEHLDNFLCK